MFIDGVLARVVALHWAGNDDELLSAIGDGEISVVGWERPENLISYSSLRIGVRNVLQNCLNSGVFEVNSFSGENLLPLSISNLERAREVPG